MGQVALTLIGTVPQNPLLATHADQVCARLNLDCPLDWLTENEAADLIFTSEKSAARITAQALAALQGTAIDAVCTPIAGRRKKILISDMDSTIIDQECIDELADAIGAGHAVRKITQNVVNGSIGFSEALRQRMTLLKGLHTSSLERVYAERISLKPGARTLVQTMRHHGAYCILVSGGFSFFTSRIAEKLGFHDDQANELVIAGDMLTGEVLEPILGRSAKLEILQQLCFERNLAPVDVLAVGDGANDIEMIREAGLGVAFHASQALKNKANACIDHAGLTALLFAQGYKKSEFVSF